MYAYPLFPTLSPICTFAHIEQIIPHVCTTTPANNLYKP